MKEAELRRCDLCRKKIGESGLPLFWRVTVERFGVDMQAVRRQDGLGQFMGSMLLAGVMGPGEDMAKPMMDPKVLTVCETCAMDELGRLVASALETAG